ncbi:Poly(A) RNA polymerase GLD2 [Fukomys damarensis]|uniref:polynucleotide adenylyltransferase n=1 Tax=Fukomys damarensis TaxID=885580 RepID=A0A091E171_FUKDA|nr:Poly(A) RNA polymerase GLD2 [Fukomys damarensis]
MSLMVSHPLWQEDRWWLGFGKNGRVWQIGRVHSSGSLFSVSSPTPVTSPHCPVLLRDRSGKIVSKLLHGVSKGSGERRRLSDEKNLPLDGKRQRFHSPHQDPTVVNQIVPLSGERRYSMPPLFHTPYVPEIVRCVSPFREISFLEPREITLPEAKDKLSQQILELFETCQQQVSDLKKKELCRTQLQREVQLLFPQSRLFLVGSSLNGFGTRSSDGDLCLVVKEEPVNQKTEARHILLLVHKHFCTRLSGYIERPQLIRAKVPIVKFRDKVSWSSQMVSVREAKAIPRPDGIEWRNKYICVEEPFDGTNTARAVHEKQKFDMIKDQFLKSFHRLKNKRDLNSILPLRTALLKR